MPYRQTTIRCMAAFRQTRAATAMSLLSRKNAYLQAMHSLQLLQETELRSGLRYEYVATKEFPTNIKRNYSDLFPYISIGYDIDEYGKWKVTASYSRKIARPLFSQQNPYENADIVVYLCDSGILPCALNT